MITDVREPFFIDLKETEQPCMAYLHHPFSVDFQWSEYGIGRIVFNPKLEPHMHGQGSNATIAAPGMDPAMVRAVLHRLIDNAVFV